MEKGLEASGNSVLQALRPALRLRDPAQRWRRSRRVGHSNAPPGRLPGVQEVFANEITNEEGSLAKINRQANEMPGILAQQSSGDLGFDTVLTQEHVLLAQHSSNAEPPTVGTN